ncbi:Phage integrase family protein [Bradyrhizobium erythrophlei]|nr:Phage integrase family protein [Bradyrhizobium erythrophlei]
MNGLRWATDFQKVVHGTSWRFRLLTSTTKQPKFPMPSSTLAADFLRSTSSNRTYFLAAFTMASTGLRNSEMCAVNIDAIPFHFLRDPDWEGFTLDVVGKGGHHRTVSVGRDLVEAFQIYAENERKELLKICAQRETSEVYQDAAKALLVNSHGRRIAPRSMWAAFKRFARLAGLPHVHPHLLRHWYAANRLRAHHEEIKKQRPGITTAELRSELLTTIASIKKELGHRMVATTLIYLDAYLEELAQPQRLALQTNLWNSMS